MEKQKGYESVPTQDSLEDGAIMGSNNSRTSPNSLFRRCWQSLAALLVLAVYTLVVAVLAKKTSGQTSPFGGNIIRSPAMDYIKYETREVDYLDWKESSAYFGEPSKEIDSNWHELVRYHNIGLSKSFMEEVGRLDQAVRFPDGRYFGSMMAFHHLHCLKHIYHQLHPERYGDANQTAEEQKQLRSHTEHCLGALKAYVMCKADPTIETMKWAPGKRLPLHNVTSTHQCVRWDSLMDYAKANTVDVFAEGMLVHPDLGPAFPHH